MKTKKLLSGLSIVGFLIVLGVLYSFTTKTVTKMTEQQPKWENLKVLPKDISKDSLEYLMKSYSNSLGVKCSYCHSPRKDDPKKLDFADESKTEKHVARGMIQMTQDINENYFKPYYPDPKPHQVTDVSCVMCHRGTAKPQQYLKSIGSMYPEMKKQEKE